MKNKAQSKEYPKKPTCPMCGEHPEEGCTCSCEGQQLLNSLSRIGIEWMPEHYRLYEKEYIALQERIISIYSKTDFHFNAKSGTLQLAGNGYHENFGEQSEQDKISRKFGCDRCCRHNSLSPSTNFAKCESCKDGSNWEKRDEEGEDEGEDV